MTDYMSKMLNRIFLTGCILCCVVFDSAFTSTNVTSLNRRKRQNHGCMLPSHPANGQWTLLNGYGNPGDEVRTNTVLEFGCHVGHKLDGIKHVICLSGWNVKKMPECEPICDPRVSTSTTQLQCFDRRGNEIDCKEATSGSYMRYDCKSFYEPSPGQRKIIYCMDGIWSHEAPTCRPICGRKNEAMSLIHGGEILNKLTYPWIVAIYKKENNKYTNICGGTIIHRKAVLTAAHCVTNEYENVLPVEDFYIAGAKLYNNYGDSRDKDAQYIRASQFIVHSQFKGDSRRFLADIALVVTETPFKLNSLVRPVCINDLSSIHLPPGSIGEIAGWGVTETGLPSEELRALEIPHKNDQICVRELPPAWADRYNLLDKMCAGYPEKNVSVCKGDSGAGLAFKNPEDDRYYVHGIVSLAPITDTGSSCNIQTNALYTKVSFYYDFVDIQLNRLNWCTLPNYPKNGKWVLQKSSSKAPGDLVSPYDIIEVSCNKGYSLNSPSSIFNCETLVSNIPACISTGNADDKSEEEKSTKRTPSHAMIATDLEEYCGMKINGLIDDVQHLDHPWVVGIYKLKLFQSHGTIISKRLVISVARYLSVWGNWTALNPDELTVTTGKFYFPYTDYRDADVTYYRVKKVFIFPGFKGVGDGLYGDFGFVVIKGTMEFNQWVKPVCVKGMNNILMPPESIVEIVGWVNNENQLISAAHTYQVVLKTVGKCLSETPDLGSYLSQDVLCGGAAKSSVCVRDHGASLVYQNPTDSRYYLTAIFAFSMSNCIRNNTFYVNMKYHYNYVMEQIAIYT